MLPAIPQQRVQQREVLATPRDELREFLELGHAHRGLQIGELQVVADVAVRVLVIVSVRKLAELRLEARAAGILLPRRAPAVAAPVAERLDEVAQLGTV